MGSLEIREFERTLKDFIGKYALPWEVKKIILEKIASDAAAFADEEVAKELEERERINE